LVGLLPVMTIRDNEFDVPFFRENGFARRKCVSCGSHFWAQDPSKEDCGDAPCQEYTFIGNSPACRSYTLSEMRREFLSFFERNSHTVVKPYPVIARWRNDVYLTGASIFDFQPYVTEGIFPPPANPLVISQPCMRLTDIDNVGPTMGRHLTILEMGGAHAFNYPDAEIYWKDQTIRYHHELLTKVLGVKSELVQYKEHFWSGGGNAGPDLEASVNGLEISTLVFMSYKIVGDELVELPIRTVDTGYGIERWTWLTQGSTNAFESIYGEILDSVVRLANVKVEEKLFATSARLSGMMIVDTLSDRMESRKRVARRLGIDWQELEKLLTPIENAFAVVDHTKSIAFMLSEGVVPSNVQEGYLARLLIRRTLRLLRNLRIENQLQSIVDAQVSYWGGDFPILKEMREEIMRALQVEEKKYQGTLERGRDLVRRISSELKSKGSGEMPLEKLIELHDSHGLMPDEVKEVGEKGGIMVKVPTNFFGLVAGKRMQAPQPMETEAEREMKKKVAGLPPTRTLYYEDSYMTKFKAKVLASFNDGSFVLDATCFYPEGGGQPADLGKITTPKESRNIVNVQKAGNVVLHFATGEAPKMGETVEGEIDWNRRLNLMRHHTGTHILMGAIRRVLGEHAWQSGAQKDVDFARLDVSHYEKLSREEVERIERLANEIVLRNLLVETLWMPREKAEQLYGYRLYQGGIVPGRDIRVVKTEDWEVEACGGTHCRTTGELGFIKVLRVERVQDGVERITFAAGIPALETSQGKDRTLDELAVLLEKPSDQIVRTVRELVDDRHRLSKQLGQLTEDAMAVEAERLLKTARKVGAVQLVTCKRTEGSEEEAIVLADLLAKKDEHTVSVIVVVKETARVIVSAGKKAIESGIDAGKVAKELAPILGGSGGGKPYFGQGGGTNLKEAERTLRAAEKVVSNMTQSK